MKKYLILAAVGAALMPIGASAKTVSHPQSARHLVQHPRHWTQQSRHGTQQSRHPAVEAQQQVACTVLGCMPIPRACMPKEEHTFSGIPTGFDTIVCPPGVWPF